MTKLQQMVQPNLCWILTKEPDATFSQYTDLEFIRLLNDDLELDMLAQRRPSHLSHATFLLLLL